MSDTMYIKGVEGRLILMPDNGMKRVPDDEVSHVVRSAYYTKAVNEGDLIETDQDGNPLDADDEAEKAAAEAKARAEERAAVKSGKQKTLKADDAKADTPKVDDKTEAGKAGPKPTVEDEVKAPKNGASGAKVAEVPKIH